MGECPQYSTCVLRSLSELASRRKKRIDIVHWALRRQTWKTRLLCRDRTLRRCSDTAAPNSPRRRVRSRQSEFVIAMTMAPTLGAGRHCHRQALGERRRGEGVCTLHVARQTNIQAQARNHYGSGPVWKLGYSVMDGDFVDCAKTPGSPDYHWREAVQTGPLPYAKTVLAPRCLGGAQNQWQSP